MTTGVWLATPTWADPFSQHGTPDGLLGALSQPASTGHLETETTNNFLLTDTDAHRSGDHHQVDPVGNCPGEYSATSRSRSITSSRGLGRPLGERALHSQLTRGCRDRHHHARWEPRNARFQHSLLDELSVLNTVMDGINRAPTNVTDGEGPASGTVVQITITFIPDRPAGGITHYFFHQEVQVAGGDFLYLSAPKPIVAPGTPVTGDFQAWIRNSDLPDRTGCEWVPTSSAAPPRRRSIWQFPDRRDRSSGRNSCGDRQRPWRPRSQRQPPQSPPATTMAAVPVLGPARRQTTEPSGSWWRGRGVVVDAPAARVKDAA